MCRVMQTERSGQVMFAEAELRDSDLNRCEDMTAQRLLFWRISRGRTAVPCLNSRILARALLFASLTAAFGCQVPGVLRPVDIVVTRDGSIAGAMPLEVDLIGADLSLSKVLAKKNVSEYFRRGGRGEQDANAFRMAFSEQEEVTKTLSRRDPKWSHWVQSDAEHLVVIASLPGYPEVTPPGQDGRRLILPLVYERSALKRIEVTVNRNWIDALTIFDPRAPNSSPVQCRHHRSRSRSQADQLADVLRIRRQAEAAFRAITGSDSDISADVIAKAMELKQRADKHFDEGVYPKAAALYRRLLDICAQAVQQ